MRGKPRHPGESLWADWIEPLGLSVDSAAMRLGVSTETLQAVCDGRAPITRELAGQIDRVFGGGADTWLALQEAHSQSSARATEVAD